MGAVPAGLAPARFRAPHGNGLRERCLADLACSWRHQRSGVSAEKSVEFP